MIKYIYRITLVAAIATLLLSSCVSTKKYEELQSQYYDLKASKVKLEDQFAELQAKGAELQRQQKELEDANATLVSEKESLQKRFDELAKLQEKNLANYNQETSALLKQIQQDQDALERKENELRERTEKFNKLQADFNAHRSRLLELERSLAAKDSVTNALRRKVADALLGFEGKGLTVTQKNGKVYVSLEEKLLFKSGSYDIESRGAEALRELGKVLEKNPDINVMVEGHTDDVPLRGSKDLQDNWDLSAKRATTVVRTLLNGTNINAQRITASGRSEYLPIDPAKTSEARQKNRRTEIILTPKLDELLEILNSNE